MLVLCRVAMAISLAACSLRNESRGFAQLELKAEEDHMRVSQDVKKALAGAEQPGTEMPSDEEGSEVQEQEQPAEKMQEKQGGANPVMHQTAESLGDNFE